jgi:hypothetical protein
MLSDTEEPGSEWNASFTIVGQCVQRAEEHLLHDVCGLLIAGNVGAQVAIDWAAISLVERGERLRILLSGGDQRRFIRPIYLNRRA